ncbi:alkylhydroperoxidase AhpD family core domain protein [Leptolyngbyaceae cyanobacterium JSC-12]|nr:alkylhydroperoxidase AhpD family core domain protein [Leptolyngbyaceae cyanobacterium JSC-12]
MEPYYKPEHLPNFSKIGEGNPELADKFFAYYGAVFAEGALSTREKALIALAVAHAVQCPYCIDAYSKECLQQGADLEQMTEHNLASYRSRKNDRQSTGEESL